MSLFGKGPSGGLMNVIRCDEPEYLVWKWRPKGEAANTTSRENAIRYGSSLRVKDGEVAVFVYKQPDGIMQDFVYGPFDSTIKTANLPVLATIVGTAFGGESPFQADIYFINLAKVIKMKFGVPFFDVADPRFIDYVVPVAVGGSVTFNIDSAQRFIKAHRLINFSIESLREQVNDAVTRRVKEVVSNLPMETDTALVQIERRIADANRMLNELLAPDFNEFGVNLVRVDLSRIDPDKQSPGWIQLRHVTEEQQTRTIDAQTEVNIRNLSDTQRINAQNMEETLRIQREEAQRAQRLQTETQFIGAHALDRQADVMQTAAESLGEMGAGTSIGGDGSGGMNPAGIMSGMMMGGAVGGQMANMFNRMGSAMNAQFDTGGVTPPPAPPMYYILSDGQQAGPMDTSELQTLVANGRLTPHTYVWRSGMTDWAKAGTVAELAGFFRAPANEMPPPPPTE